MASERRSTAFAALLLLRATLGAGQEAPGDGASSCPATASEARREEAAAALRAGQAQADAEDWPQAGVSVSPRLKDEIRKRREVR